MQHINEITELSVDEVTQVSGGGILQSIGYAVGWLWGGGASNMQKIDAMDDSMLGAMQYDA
jgi:hypothetical protein